MFTVYESDGLYRVLCTHTGNEIVCDCFVKENAELIADILNVDDSEDVFFQKDIKWLYRLESIHSNNGLWYDSNSKFVWGIGKLPNCKTKDLPMDYDARYHRDGRNWYSSCSNKEDLLHWYSLKDAQDLLGEGFVFTRYLATEYVEYDLETTFIKDSSIRREVIDIGKLFS